MVLGFTGSYGRVAAFARDWRADRQREQQTTGRGIFVPLSFRPGEAFQFDWSEDYAVIGSERTKLQVAHIKLSHSRAFLVRAYLLQTHEMLFDAHWHGFRVFGGVPARGIYDNMKTAVDRVGRGKQRQVNIRFLAMTNHYVFAPEFCNPAAGWEKGQVEKNVQDSRPPPMATDAGLPGFGNVDAATTNHRERFTTGGHYLAVIQRKPGALRNGAPFLELPLAFRQLQDQMLRRLGGDREMADILALVLHHDEQVVVRAVELALDQGVATKTHVLNLLHRLIDGKTTDGPDIDTPQALTLLREPKANVERYDGLRVRIVGGRHAS